MLFVSLSNVYGWKESKKEEVLRFSFPVGLARNKLTKGASS